ncbi:JAB domain-containing protein [Desulfobacterales bacterium]|nr:JAB domain-containing protein [Desulfobacterales bacterium]
MTKSYDAFWNDLKSGRFASMVKDSAKGKPLSNSGEAYNILKPMFAEEDDIEKAYFIFMDAKNNILAIENLFKGTITASAIYPREIIKRAIILKSTAFIMAHNHPSGDTNPSSEDEFITRKITLAASSIDVQFHDHIIIGEGYHSMADSGLLSRLKSDFNKVLDDNTCHESQTQLSDKINLEIMENELSATDWSLNPLAWDLYWFVDLFQAVFFRNEPVPVPALTFEKARVNTLGHYRIGRNDFAVREQINLNRLHIGRPLWGVLSTLLHEMAHSWEYTYVPENKRTKSWYHSKAFRVKMEEFGIHCADNGAHIGLESNGRFVFLLKQHGVTFDEIPDFSTMISGGGKLIPIDPKPKVKGKSKLKKWTCGCQIVRIGKREFCATCDICNNKFKIDE